MTDNTELERLRADAFVKAMSAALWSSSPTVRDGYLRDAFVAVSIAREETSRASGGGGEYAPREETDPFAATAQAPAPSPSSEPAQGTGEATTADMIAFGASDAACTFYPEDTPEHVAARKAYCDGAASMATSVDAANARIAKLERERDERDENYHALMLLHNEASIKRGTAEAALADLRERVRSQLIDWNDAEWCLPGIDDLFALLTPSPTAGDTDTPAPAPDMSETPVSQEEQAARIKELEGERDRYGHKWAEARADVRSAEEALAALRGSVEDELRAVDNATPGRAAEITAFACKRIRALLSSPAQPDKDAQPARGDGPAPAQDADYAIVRVDDTCDGLAIHRDDAKRLGLVWDRHYPGEFLPDGRYRIRLFPDEPVSSPSPDMSGVTVHPLVGTLVKVPGLAYGDVPFRVLGVDGQKAWLKDDARGWSYTENVAALAALQGGTDV